MGPVYALAGPVSIILIIWVLLGYPQLCWCTRLRALADEASALVDLAIIIAFLATVWELVFSVVPQKGYRVMVIAWGKFQKAIKEQREKERLMEIDRFVRLWFPDLGDEEREQLVQHLKDGGTYPDWRGGQAHGNGIH
jgi:hypothetical protein